MAKKKKGLTVGGVTFDPHFNDPGLQKAYQKLFVDMPLRAPVEVEYYDPTETSSGEVKRSPINTTIDPYETARGEMMQKYKYGWESGDDAVFKQAPIVKVPIKKTASSGKQNDTKDLAKGVASTNQRIAALGGKPVGQQSHGSSIWNRTLDVLSRGMYASAETVHARNEARKKDHSFLGIPTFEAMGKGFWQGLSGKKKTTYEKVLHDDMDLGGKIAAGLHAIGTDKGFNHNLSKQVGRGTEAALGLTGDILLDPSTYLGVGMVGKGGRAAKAVEKATEHLSQGSKIASRGKKTVKTFDDVEHDVLSGKRHLSGQMKHSEEALIYEPLRNMRNSIKNTRMAEIKAELRTTPKYADMFDRGGVKNHASLSVATKALNKEAGEAAAKESEHWFSTAVKNYQDAVNTQVSKGIGIGIVGKNGKKITIVPAPVVDFTKMKVHNIDVVDRGLKAASKYLQASAGVGPELHTMRLQATNQGFSRAEQQLTRLRHAWSGVHRDLREDAWHNALDRKASGQTIKIDGLEKDAAESLSEDIDVLEHMITGTTTGDTPMSARELRNFMPPGTKDRWKISNASPGVADIRKSMKKWDITDGPRALFVAQQAVERARAMRSMYVSAADTFGVRTAGGGAMKNAEHIFGDLKRRGWREVSENKTHGLLKGVLFDDETASGIEKIIDLTNNERNWNGFLRKLARITGPIKTGLTVYNPGYHIRNAMGDAFINELDNTSIKSYEQAAHVLSGVSEKYGGANPLIMSEGNILENAFKRGNQNVLFHTKTPLRKPNGVRSSAVTEAEIYAGMHKFGITQNFTLSQMINVNDNPGALARLGGGVREKITAASELRENYFRLAHFVELVKRNPTGARTLEENMAAAAARIRKTHFDYTDFTRFEKQVASNIVPFYKWTRKAVPLMLEVMFTNPGKAIVPSKAQHALSYMLGNDDPLAQDPFPQMAGMLPQWMIDAGYSPGTGSFFGHNNPTMFGLSSPFTDTFTQTLEPGIDAVASGSPKKMLNFIGQQANPALKVPYELTQNENIFLSKDQTVPVYREGTEKKDIATYIANQFPYARQILRATAGGSDKQNYGALASQLGGVYTQEVTPSMQRGELYRQQGIATKRLDKLKKDITKKLESQGVAPPATTTEWEELFEGLDPEYERPSKKRFKSVLVR